MTYITVVASKGSTYYEVRKCIHTPDDLSVIASIQTITPESKILIPHGRITLKQYKDLIY